MPDASITSTESTFGTISGTFTADQSTISGTVYAITGTVDGSVGVPGPQGPAGSPGATGPQGPQGVPGVGVPSGGSTGMVLQKASATAYDTIWASPSGGTWGSITGTLSNQTDLQNALDAKQSVSGMSAYLSKAGNLAGLTDLATARDNLNLGSLNTPVFNGVTAQGSGLNVANLGATYLTLNHTGYGQFIIQPSTGITFPDTTIQTTAFNATALLPYALVDSQAFTGTPFLPTGTTGVTQALGDNDTSLATTAFVQQELLSGTANARNLEVYVRNQTGSTLAAGTIVYINGATGNRPTVTPAQANNDANSAQTFGFVKTSIANNGFGFVIVRGELENINTSALTEGAQLYLSPTTAGTWTTTKPSAPQHLVYVGIVVRAHPTQGVILVAVQNGYEISELHDVKITGPTNGQVLKYDSTQSLWVNGTDVGGVAWGGITGTLSSQTDLQTQLDSKFNQSGGTISGPVTLPDVGSLTTTVLGNAGLIVSNDNDPAENVEINYSGLLVKSATQTLAVYPGQINFPDSTIQTTAFIAANYASIAGATFTGVVGFNGNPGNVSAKSTGYFKAYTSGAENTDYSLQYDTGFQVVVGGTTVARIAASGIVAPSAGITFSDATTQTSAGITAATAASTYQTLSGMSSYLTTATAASTYQTISGMSSYLTTASAASTYFTIASAANKADLASPALTGTPTAPTATAATNTTQIATTAFVTTADNLKANLASPTFTGVPAAPTATAGTNTTQIATTAFVRADNNVKAWVNFNGTGTVAIRASFNVSSITDNGAGDYTVNFTTAMTDANYAMSGFAGESAFTVGVVLSSWGTYTQTTSAFRLKVYYGFNTVIDTANILATFIR